MSDVAERRRIKQAVTEALEEVYRCVAIQGSLNEKQKRLIELIVQKLLGVEPPPPPPPKKRLEDGVAVYICDKCNKKCKSLAGLTLHLKKHIKV